MSEPRPSTPPPRGSLPPEERASRASLLDVAHAPVAKGRAAAQSLGLTGVLVAALVIVVVDFGLAIHLWASIPLTVLQTALAFPWMELVLRAETGERRPRGWLPKARMLLAHFVNIGLLAFALVEKWIALVGALHASDVTPFVSSYRSFSVVALVMATLGILGRGHRAQRFLADAADHPARLMVLSFGITAFLGGFLLTLPEAVVRVEDASFLDGLFTATSAVCVTGLAVNDVGATYTFFGEAVIVVLAQIGGLGIMVLSASFVVLAGRKLRVKQSAVLVEMIDAGSLAALRRTLIAIVGYTLLFEAIGALLLYAFTGFHPEVMRGPDDPHPIAGAGDRAWWSVFTAVSAFCNAGFCLSHANLAGFAASWPICLTVAALITVGGIGFPVIDELRRHAWERVRRRRPDRLSLHARIVLGTSAMLTLGVAAILLVLEWSQSLAHLPWHARVLASLFQSVSMRTAGFNTIDLGAMRAVSIALACVVMVIGASPGSTGGGIKTTSFAAICAEVWAELRGHASARLLDRRLEPGVVRRAMGVTFLSLAIVMLGTFAMLMTEDHEPLRILFEVCSAFSTAGLSTGITSSLSPAGKLVLIVMMFAGRTGPLTLALAMATETKRTPVQLASERVMIG
ncbi:TrkH family potassium uptake protein [Sandaracinus amylolyticus]|uniref:TrkH family potassium uptake protein n=1 Tax=Sandaracinus amylolyticus TaxID=927083 RepID=UPI00069FECA4|nr:potassium transporter TrkG [Sandaracinus amylolyticus]